MLDALSPDAQRFLHDLSTINARQSRAQRQLSSGLRLERASDDPDQVSLLLEARAELARATQMGSDLGRVKTETDTASSAVSSAVDLIERARVLGAEGANDTQNANSRQALAGEVTDLITNLVRVANTQVEGRYVFSGNSDQTPAYAIDWTQPSPLSPYQGSAATRQVLTASGDTFAVSHSADQIFDNPDPSQNAFQAMMGLRTALLNNDTTAIQTALTSVGSALTHVNNELSFYGSVQNQVTRATDDASSRVTQLKVRVSSIEDADAALAITEFQQASLAEQAALEVRAKMPTRTLFDYLG